MSDSRRPSLRDFALYACVPLVFTAVALGIFGQTGDFAGDFHKEFWPAGLRVLHGHSPYLLGHREIANGLGFPYPPLTALALAPFALVARSASEILFTAICFAALFATLAINGVRDWRLYGLVLLWAPVVNAWQSANLTLPLVLGISLMWRYRGRPRAAGVIAAVAICLKPFVWPVGLWLFATRRYAAAAWCAAATIAINLAGLGVIGFGEVGRYLDDARHVSGVFFRHAYTPVALALHAGLASGASTALGVVAGGAAAAAVIALGRRGDELGALSAAIALMLLATPVLWMHYFALLVVPLALVRPRLEPIWALPIVLLACGSRSTQAWQIVAALTIAATIVGLTIHRARPIARAVPSLA